MIKMSIRRVGAVEQRSEYANLFHGIIGVFYSLRARLFRATYCSKRFYRRKIPPGIVVREGKEYGHY